MNFVIKINKTLWNFEYQQATIQNFANMTKLR